MKQNKLISESSDWNFDTLTRAYEIIEKIATKELKLDVYPNQIEIVSSEQMLDAYSLAGLPTSYPHWSFGKDFMYNATNYVKGRQNLAYELVINSNPCISYNMEDNTTCMMMLVIAHACFGHNTFFKNNYLFKQWTDADNIISYMTYARDFILKCEEKYGFDEVETVLDAAHALQRLSVDKYKRPKKLSADKEKHRLSELIKFEEEHYSELNTALPKSIKERIQKDMEEESDNTAEEDNILFFIEKNASNLPHWKREILRICRYIGQYYYPQISTKTINEGTATFVHHYIMNRLYEKGYINDSFYLEFIKSHTSVVFQPSYKKHPSFNPYALGYNIFHDIKRMSLNPTEEDKQWFPNLIKNHWLDNFHFIINNFRDDSFIHQYLSPKVIRDMKLFMIKDEEIEEEYVITAIHNERGYKKIRKALADMHSRDFYIPTIRVTSVDEQTRKLTLTHFTRNDIMLDEDDAVDTILLVQSLWGYPVELIAKYEDGLEEYLMDVD